MSTEMLYVIDRKLTRDAPANLYIAEAVVLRDQDRLCLEKWLKILALVPSTGSKTTHLDKVGRITIVIDTTCIETRPSALRSQARNETERRDDWSAVRRGCRKRDRKHAYIALDGKDLSQYGEQPYMIPYCADIKWGRTLTMNWQRSRSSRSCMSSRSRKSSKLR